MAEPIVVLDAAHGTLSGYEQGCRCEWCRPAGERIAADGTPELAVPGGTGRKPGRRAR